TMPNKASIALGFQSRIAGTTAGVCEVGLAANAPVRRVGSDRVRFGGKHLGAIAIRVSAGSFRSLASLRINARREAAGWSNPIARILSRRIVRLFDVPRFRPPRRSPGLEPRSMFASLATPAALRARVAHAQDCRERGPSRARRPAEIFDLLDFVGLILPINR